MLSELKVGQGHIQSPLLWNSDRTALYAMTDEKVTNHCHSQSLAQGKLDEKHNTCCMTMGLFNVCSVVSWFAIMKRY